MVVRLGRRGRIPAQPDDRLDGRAGHGVPRDRRERILDAQHASARVAEHVGDLLGGEHEVDRNQNGPKTRHREPDRNEMVRVA